MAVHDPRDLIGFGAGRYQRAPRNVEECEEVQVTFFSIQVERLVAVVVVRRSSRRHCCCCYYLLPIEM